MTRRLFARLAIAHPKTHKISLSKDFIEVSERDVTQMVLPDHVVRIDLFEAREHEKPARRIILGVEQIYSHADIEDEFGQFFADKIAEAGAGHAAFIPDLGKLIPTLPGDEIWHRNGQAARIS